MQSIIEAKDLCKNYLLGKDNQIATLKNINLQIYPREFVSLMGPSGSGKSTLLYNLSGMDRCTSGKVMFESQDLTAFSEKDLATLRLRKMGFIFQQIHLLKTLSLFDNIVFPAYQARSSDRKAIDQRARTLMEKMAIATLANNDITQASGGQLQRVAICRALINEPTIIFGDEPTGALNSKAARDIMDILTALNAEGATILLATHDVKVAAKTERVIFLLDGKVIAEQQLGKYRQEDDDITERERLLSDWLLNLGF